MSVSVEVCLVALALAALVPATGSPPRRASDAPLAAEERNETSALRCLLPMKPGPCEMYVPRFYYHVTSHRCLPFIYGGCDANGNNFMSRKECQTACSGVTERCLLPMKPGPCKVYVPRFYYDVTSHRCLPFIYGGCQANGNNFMEKEECETACSGVTGPV